MNAVMLAPNIYQGARQYAKAHNISVDKFVEGIIIDVLSSYKPIQTHPHADSEEMQQALAYMDTLVADDLTSPVLVNEDARMALVDEKYL